MKIKKLLLASCVMAMGLAGVAATAGVVIEQEQREPETNALVWKTTLYLDAGRVRLETESTEGDHTVTLFDETKQTMWVIDLNARTYYEMTGARIRDLSKRMAAARKEMEAQLAQMPPEQRQVIEEMMKQQMGEGDTLVRETARGVQVGAFVCTHYDQLSNGERTGEIWTASFDQLQLREAEFKTFQALSRFLEPLGHGAPGAAPYLPAGERLEGFPVRSLTYDGERVVAEEKVTKAERRALEAGLFALPPDLERIEPEMPE